MSAREQVSDTIRDELLRTRNCSCPLGMTYHANNCPTHPAQLNEVAALDALLAEIEALKEALLLLRTESLRVEQALADAERYIESISQTLREEHGGEADEAKDKPGTLGSDAATKGCSASEFDLQTDERELACGCFTKKVADSWRITGQASRCLSEHRLGQDAIATCPTQVYHGTHRYCPSCPWTEDYDGGEAGSRAAGGERA